MTGWGWWRSDPEGPSLLGLLRDNLRRFWGEWRADTTRPMQEWKRAAWHAEAKKLEFRRAEAK